MFVLRTLALVRSLAAQPILQRCLQQSAGVAIRGGQGARRFSIFNPSNQGHFRDRPWTSRYSPKHPAAFSLAVRKADRPEHPSLPRFGSHPVSSRITRTTLQKRLPHSSRKNL